MATTLNPSAVRQNTHPRSAVAIVAMAVVCLAVGVRSARAQSDTAEPSSRSITAEAEFSAGQSTEEVSAAAAALRVFGATDSDWRYYAEASWGRTSAEYVSDAFGAGYPYDKRVRPMEIYVEKMFRPRGKLLGVRTGLYRTPFGISGRSDHAYIGFLRAPLIRYGGNWSLSTSFLESGADVLVGTSTLSLETSVGRPADASTLARRPGLDVALRGQGFYRGVIAGASLLVTQPNMSPDFAFGRMVFKGVDARWMRGGFQLRGEWIAGRPFDGVTTDGGYADLILHRIGMGPITLVARIERLDYDAGPFSEYLRRATVGARVRITRNVTLQMNALRQSARPVPTRPSALDIGITSSLRF